MKILIKNIILVLFLWISGTSSAEAQGTRVDFSTIHKSGTILIYSHLDDDLIWMLPFWSITEKFIGGAMPTAPRYNTIIHQQQAFLDNNGYDIDYESNWFTPWDPITDSEYTEYYWANDPSYSYLSSDHIEYRSHLNRVQMPAKEINKVKAKLEQFFADPGMKRVITHNNWGEYGHAHHQAVNQAARELAVKYRKDVWMLGCDNGVFKDINVPSGIKYTMGDFNDRDLYLGIRKIYENNGRWTWNTDPDRIPSGEHKFIEIVEGGADKSNILTGVSITTSGPYQDEPGAYIFDGNDDYMTLKGNNNGSFTIALKIRPDQIREMDISAMSEYPSSGKNDRNLYMNSDGRISARIYDGSSRVVTSSARIAADTWTHITITGNGSNLRLFINGTLDRTISAGTAITNYSTPEFVMGQATETDKYFDGQICDVRMYNRALSDNEIAQLSGKGYTVTSTAGTGGTITPSGSIAVTAGAGISFSIRPSPGYRIADVRVDGASEGAISSFEFNDISGNHTITATFQRITIPVLSKAGLGGSIKPEGTINVNYGSDQTFTIMPDIGYHISDVKVDGTSTGRISEFTFSNITADHTISAEFSINTYAITGNSTTGGSIIPEGANTSNYGSSLVFTLVPDIGYHISDVIVDGASIGSVSDFTFNNITSDHTISAEFSINTYTVTGNSTAGGSIIPEGANTGNYGSTLVFKLVPDIGYHISDVKVDGISIGSISEFTFSNLTANHTITAEFSINTYHVTADCSSGGSITPSGIVILTHGMDQLFIISPQNGYQIDDVLVDDISVGKVSEYIFKNITGDHSISARFIKTFIISADAGYGGSITPSGIIILPEGTSIKFTITPDRDYRIRDVTVDSYSMGDVAEYTFTGVVSDHTLSASFTNSIDLVVFPNPFNKQLSLKIKSPAEYQFEMFIMTLTNKIVYRQDNIPGNSLTQINPDLVPGSYILKLYLKGNSVFTIKIIRY